jgi:hypothetical protein
MGLSQAWKRAQMSTHCTSCTPSLMAGYALKDADWCQKSAAPVNPVVVTACKPAPLTKPLWQLLVISEELKGGSGDEAGQGGLDNPCCSTHLLLLVHCCSW